MSNTLLISDISIRQDTDGRFCLNDAHKASGGESRHQPANWLRNQQAIDLIEFLKSEESITKIPVILTKQGLGTFASYENHADYRQRTGIFREKIKKSRKKWFGCFRGWGIEIGFMSVIAQYAVFGAQKAWGHSHA